jgi:hypothetical protein
VKQGGVDDEDDMFADEDPLDLVAAVGPGGAAGGGTADDDVDEEPGPAAAAPVAALADAYDDHEGYYVFQVSSTGSS